MTETTTVDEDEMAQAAAASEIAEAERAERLELLQPMVPIVGSEAWVEVVNALENFTSTAVQMPSLTSHWQAALVGLRNLEIAFNREMS